MLVVVRRLPEIILPDVGPKESAKMMLKKAEYSAKLI